jgi:hypothetical protein
MGGVDVAAPGRGGMAGVPWVVMEEVVVVVVELLVRDARALRRAGEGVTPE